MARLSYDSVEALIYDPVSANRTATRAALYSLGFRRTETVPTLEGMVEIIQKQPPDLVLAETQGAADELVSPSSNCARARGLQSLHRHHRDRLGKKPGLITKVVNSGADDLLLRPFSHRAVGQPIETHIERRKGFVITTDYVGPDRRRDVGRERHIEMFDPPNSLKMKAKDKMPADLIAKRLDAELQVAREKLTVEKLRRDFSRSASCGGCCRSSALNTAPVRRRPDQAGRSDPSIERALPEAEFEKAVEWCSSILAAAEGLGWAWTSTPRCIFWGMPR